MRVPRLRIYRPGHECLGAARGIERLIEQASTVLVTMVEHGVLDAEILAQVTPTDGYGWEITLRSASLPTDRDACDRFENAVGRMAKHEFSADPYSDDSGSWIRWARETNDNVLAYDSAAFFLLRHPSEPGAIDS